MPETQVLFSRGGWELKVFSGMNPEIEALLMNTIWGTEGGVRYKHTHIQQIPDTYYLCLLRDGNILGCVGFVYKALRMVGVDRPIRSYYIRYLAIDSGLQTQVKVGKPREPKTSKGIRGSKGNRFFKNRVRQFFEESDFLARQHGDPSDPMLFYSYVIINNQRSSHLVKDFEFVPLRQMHTIVFSRIFTRAFPQVRKLTADQIPQLNQLLLEQYEDHGTVSLKDLQISEAYYVWEEQGEIVAGVQVRPIQWEVKEIPGRGGKVLQKVVPHIPMLSRVFNPNAYRFAAFDCLYCKEGYESRLTDLWNHACHAEKLHSALFWVDQDSSWYRRLQNMKRMGILSSLIQDSGAVHILARGQNLPDKLETLFSNGPHYISSKEVT